MVSADSYFSSRQGRETGYSCFFSPLILRRSNFTIYHFLRISWSSKIDAHQVLGLKESLLSQITLLFS